MKTNIKVLDDFSYYLSTIRGYSPITVKGYYSDLILLFTFLNSYLEWNVDLGDIDISFLSKVEENAIFAYLSYLISYKNNGSSTRKRKVASAKSFFKWLYTKYDKTLKKENNPTLSVACVEKTRRLPKYLKLEDALRIQSIFNETNSKNYIRDNTIIILFLNSGIRLAELVNINIKDINLELKELRIIGKGNRERTVYLNKKVLKQLELYLSTRTDDYEALFLSSCKTRLKPNSVEHICNKAFALAGLGGCGYTTHTLRHTAATHIYAQTNDILIVKEFLGHTNIASTEIYTHISNKELKEAADRHPLNNIS